MQLSGMHQIMVETDGNKHVRAGRVCHSFCVLHILLLLSSAVHKAFGPQVPYDNLLLIYCFHII